SAGSGRQGLTLEAQRIGGRTGEQLSAIGKVRLRQGGITLEADRIDYSLASDRAHASGGVSLRRGADVYSGPELDIDTETMEGYFLSPSFTIARTQGRGHAARADFLGENRVAITGASYTTCRADEGQQPAWVLSASTMRLDFGANDGYAEGAVLRFYEVPILALPLLSFPVTDARKSGWLPPMLNLASTSGVEFGLPFYWNISPQTDATLMPTYSSRRGSGIDTEFRYLLDDVKGDVRLVDLPYDQTSGRARWALRSRLNTSTETTSPTDTGLGWSADLDLLRVSDDNYWRDGLRGADNLTPRLLGTRAQTMHTGRSRWWGADIDQTVYARLQRWQVLQSSDSSAAIAPPYQRAPQIGAQWHAQLGQAELQLQTEYNRFTNTDVSLPGGERAHAAGSVGWRFGDASTQFTPRLSFNSAVYQLDQPLADGRTRVGRTVPSLSLDGHWTLERDADWLRPGLRQTLEPRLFYLRTPWRDQSQLPSFDSAPLDFNATTMFADNSFSGVDRVADAHLVTAGVTSRIVDDSSGAELGQIGLAQRFLLSEQRITPDGQPLTQRASDLFLIGSTSAVPAWGLDGALQYNPDSRRVERSVATVRYTPEPFRALSATYRFQRNSSEQLALGWQWPLLGGGARRPGVDSTDISPAAQAVRAAAANARDQRYASAGSCRGTLYGVGRLDYSLRDRRMSTSIVGIEYDAGCWVTRLVAERQSTGSDSATTRWMLQLELVGLSRLGSNPLAVLKDNIPGYTLLRDSPTDPAGSASTTPGGPTAPP
ncbi:MAG: hypothetical protein RLZZ524_2896, partial [Pseudomonadota bacterium]